LSRKLFATAICGLVLFLLAPSVIAGSLTEREFWDRLERTNTLLLKAISQSGAAQQTTLASIRPLWQAVDTVQFTNGSSMTVDMAWLTENLSASTAPDLQRRVQAILDYHTRRQPALPTDSQQSLNKLDQILKDPRFHYPDPTPTAVPFEPEAQPDSSGGGSGIGIPVGLSEALLAFVGIVVVIVVLFFLARGFNIQPASLDLSDDGSDDPTTSESARERAEDSQAEQDYRTAIRYLYLESLLLLDERGLIHYDRSLTNREHLRQVSNQPNVTEALRPVVNTFDRVWYGFASVDEALYQEFVQNVERLRQLSHA
jgi:hypothetical protein